MVKLNTFIKNLQAKIIADKELYVDMLKGVIPSAIVAGLGTDASLMACFLVSIVAMVILKKLQAMK